MNLPITVSDACVAAEAARRRTFAIIAHPDAGKTTLTEKLLLKGGAIELTGRVRAKGTRRRTRSDWMKIEQDRTAAGDRRLVNEAHQVLHGADERRTMPPKPDPGARQQEWQASQRLR